MYNVHTTLESIIDFSLLAFSNFDELSPRKAESSFDKLLFRMFHSASTLALV